MMKILKKRGKGSEKKRDLGNSTMKGSNPLQYHNSHSENIALSPDKRRAKRIESFCKGICFGGRPVQVNERVYLKFAEISTSWSGVVRFGFTSVDPITINCADLPRYACPDLTNKTGYWAKALPERFAEAGAVLFFYVTRSGDVHFGIQGEEKGVFFSGVQTSSPLWVLVDIYGNTTAMEFVDGKQLNNLTPNAHIPVGGTLSQPDLAMEMGALSLTNQGNSNSRLEQQQNSQSMPVLPTGPQGVASVIRVVHHANTHFNPMPFHSTKGKKVELSPDKFTATRHDDDYCNGYVFTHRPLMCGEKLVVQIVGIDEVYEGSLAFGMTAVDPTALNSRELPDDSDLLLDRPEYWIVNKDVCPNVLIGDELSFHLTEEGMIKYGKNGHTIATLMCIDKTLPMWAFFDVYGLVTKLKCLGIVAANQTQHRGSVQSDTAGLMVALPPPRGQSASPTHRPHVTPPPRPPPPRASLGGDDTTPPLLPPKKQHRPLPGQPSFSGAILKPTPGYHRTPAPAPPPVSSRSTPTSAATPSLNPFLDLDTDGSPVASPSKPLDAAQIAKDQSEEAMDNASNECSICLDKPVDCVLYTCGHMCLCFECATDVKDNGGNLCPMCRAEIKDIIRIYRS